MENLHRFRNNTSAVALGNPSFEAAHHAGLIDLRVRMAEDDALRTPEEQYFVNFSSCSYLGLHRHPAVLAGAIEAVRREGFIELPTSRVRIRPAILAELESQLTELYRARSISTLSASVATMGVLPLLASGHLMDDGQPPVLVFDKACHFSMHLIKPICADETTVLTSPPDDLDFLEDVCKKHPRVAFVTDGASSLGGAARVRELFELQDRYGLFIFFDDSHSLSIWGERGEGFVRSAIAELNPLTVIVASLCKGFGASGGVIMLGPAQHEPVLARFGGPMAWSQKLNVPSIGAALASIAIHNSPELGQLQRQLHDNLALFDEQIATPQQGDVFPVRVVAIGEEAQAVERARTVLDRGFYCSPVFFPIVARKQAALRVMLRADHRRPDILEFCQVLREVAEL